MECSWEEEDVISKLLLQNDAEIVNFGKYFHGKSLREELLEVGERFREEPSMLAEREDEKFKLHRFMTEFTKLSKVMDKEITVTHNRLQIAQEQKEAMSCDSKICGKIDMLKQLLEEEVLKSKQIEEDCNSKLKQMEEEHKKKIKSMREALHRQRDANKDLQNEFNKVLDEKEYEIEYLTVKNNELWNEIQENGNEVNALAMENEELCDKVEIKDEYIGSLRLQITNLEKQHEQDQWKLEQSDDLLEMVEKERDRMEAKFKGTVRNLLEELKKEREKSQNINSFESETANVQTANNATVQKVNKTKALHAIGAPSGFENMPLTFPAHKTDNLQPVAEVKSNHSQKSVRPPPGFEHDDASNIKSHEMTSDTTKSPELPALSQNKDRLLKLARRSSLSRVSMKVNAVKPRNLPTVLKSLGWCDALMNRKD